MRDFYFFTSKPITAQDCYEMLKKKLKILRELQIQTK